MAPSAADHATTAGSLDVIVDSTDAESMRQGACPTAADGDVSAADQDVHASTMDSDASVSVIAADLCHSQAVDADTYAANHHVYATTTDTNACSRGSVRDQRPT